MKLEGETVTELKERLLDENDPSGPLLEASRTIDRNLSVLRDHIKAQREGSRGARQRYEESEAEELATEHTRKRQEEGHEGESDTDESLADEEKKEELEREFEESGLPKEDAEGLAAFVVSSGLKYTFAETALATSAPLFSVRRKAGVIIIKLNTKHPGYDSLIEALNEETEDDIDALRERLFRARKGLRLLLLAWARYEDEQCDEKREEIQDIRHDWGRIARQFMREMD